MRQTSGIAHNVQRLWFCIKNLKFIKIATNGKYFLARVSNRIFSKKCLFTFFENFSAKIRKRLNVRKIGTFDEETDYIEKTEGLLLEGIFNKVGSSETFWG